MIRRVVQVIFFIHFKIYSKISCFLDSQPFIEFFSIFFSSLIYVIKKNEFTDLY